MNIIIQMTMTSIEYGICTESRHNKYLKEERVRLVWEPVKKSVENSTLGSDPPPFPTPPTGESVENSTLGSDPPPFLRA